MALTTAHSRRTRFALALTTTFILAFASVLTAFANVTLTQLNTDPYTNATSQHKTEVEPDSFSFGSTIVSAVQVGRFNDGGASNIGWATSTNGGSSWTNGQLPGLTVFSSPAGPYNRATDPAVAYDAAHNVWLINSLGLTTSSGVLGAAVVVNRSTDGGLTWGNAVTVRAVTGNQNFDKNWIVCDSTSTSPFYGRCYVEYDDNGNGNALHMEYSTDGGLTWTPSSVPNVGVIGGQPVVQPNGTIVVPIDNANESAIGATVSANGGVSYSAITTITSIVDHTVAGNLRSGPLPSAEVDGSGKVYVVWQDCRFRRGCKSNDIVMTTSTNGTTWTPIVRIPIGSTSDKQDNFIPGIAVDKSTSGGSAHIAITYYFYPNAKCTSATCQLNVGYISSTTGGASWGTSMQLAGPMTLSWLPNTTQGRMVGDYISTSFNTTGTAHGVFAVATAPSGTVFNEAMFTTSSGIASGGSLVGETAAHDSIPAGINNANFHDPHSWH
jgi:hypothetical protein